jgi:homopolymeric O-antigen transport system permease protein
MAAVIESDALAASDPVAAGEARIPAPHRHRARIRRSADVLISLSRADFRSRYGRGRLRLLKWLLDPFAVTGVYLVLISVLLDRGGDAPGLSLACAVVPYHLLMTAIFNSIAATQARRAIILNMGFPRALIPASATLTETLGFGASLTVLALMMAMYGIGPTVAVLWFPVALAVTILLALALAYPAAIFGQWYPDLRPFAASFVRTLYFLAPGLVPLSEISGKAQDLVRLNPVTGLFEAYRDALLYGEAPAAWELLYPLGFAVGLLAVFVPLYRRDQRHIAKVL